MRWIDHAYLLCLVCFLLWICFNTLGVEAARHNQKTVKIRERKTQALCSRECDEEPNQGITSCVARCMSAYCADAVLLQSLEPGEVDDRQSRFRTCWRDEFLGRGHSRSEETVPDHVEV
mmetsp:Transcript_12832/g.32729  ORF Transcript_12832/g.32729 Transcript_12832/m.32729 type:complete len:119 (-) Transcript_12832:205-561(-)